MTYEQLKSLKPSAFKRRCGVHQDTSLADGRDPASASRSSRLPRWTAKTRRRRPTAGCAGVGARISHSVSYCDQLGNQ